MAPQQGSAERWIVSEGRRSLVSAGAAILVSAILTAVWLARDIELRTHVAAVAFVLAWTVYTIVHLVLTRRALLGLDEEGLRRALLPDRREAPGNGWRARLRELRTRLWDRWWSADAPEWSVQVSALALALVVLIIAVPTLRESRLLLAATLLMVAGSWANVVITYAVHYAKADLREPGLDFAGDEDRAFADYLYLALMVQATFGTTDTALLTRGMRRTVMVQTCLAFVFNTVIVALVVSLILSTVA